MVLPPWHAHADVWLILGWVEAAYLIAVRRQGTATPLADEHRKRQIRFFSVGMLVLWIGADWPIHDLAERYLYSMHMVQHLLFTLVAPPLLLAGIPAWMMRSVLRPKPVRDLWRFLTRPVVALVIFNSVLLFTHWPAVVDRAVGNELMHFSLHVVLVASAVVMWWPVMSPLPEMPALTPPGQMMYLFLQSLAPTVPASFLTFGHTLIYPVYGTFPRIWGISALTDQLLAGLEMKILGGFVLWGFITVIFFRWHAREERDGWDALAMRNVDAEVRARVTR